MKKLIKAMALGAGVVAVFLAYSAWKVRSLVSEEQLVQVIEENLNCRAHIGGLKVTMRGARASIALQDVRLGWRDGELGTSLAERMPMGEAPVTVDVVRMAVNLRGVLRKRLDVREFVLERPRVRMTMLRDGGNSLDELLRSPEDAAREGEAESETRGSGDTLNVSQLPFLTSLRGVRIEDGRCDVTVEKTGLVLSFSGLEAGLRDLEFDPARIGDLATAVDLAGTLRIDPAGGENNYGVLAFGGPVSARFFDPATGDLAPVAEADLALGDDSFLSTDIPVVQKAWRSLRKLDKVGIEIGPLPEKGTFGRSRSLALHYEAERLTVTKPVSLWLDDWELAVRKGLWIQTETEEHGAVAELMASQKLSQRFHGKLGEGLNYLPREVRPDAIAAFDAAWFREGRLFAHVESAGELSDPDLDLVNKLPDFEELGRKAFERFASDKLKDLFGR